MTDQPGAKPRLALLLSGLPRQWRECLPTQLALFQDYPCDVFFHFWDVVDASEKAEIVTLLKPRAYSFEPQRDFSFADNDPTIKHDPINVPSRMFSQYYSWRAVAKLFEPFKDEYGLAMRSRADMHFVYSISHIFPQLKPHDILFNWWESETKPQSLLCDFFALGGVEPILYFHSLYDHLADYAKRFEFNSEHLLTSHFANRPDIHIYTESFRYFFIRRPHMTNYTVEQAMLENPGRNKWLDPEIYQAHMGHHQQKKGEEGETFVKDFRHFQLRTLVDEVREKLLKDKA